MWLSTEANPGSAPNTGFFFNPAWYMVGSVISVAADVFTFAIVTEL